ncbi:LLM class flavin-dependent oxidoreductase [Granulicella sp. 5B5]|uniref:LLM class flavin-dependent oxidoreductase n=1 Tax=Granulicella sp. 5B5 TaxID=1617967 RepID=UPI0015F55361|nr:LLM class flavin-dependent oxidoreductase [Granulicella sp. 5B5]QMV19317.1 LLM class flavin-dependent oxidoreductase [Granulicella sp. 5B5]
MRYGFWLPVFGGWLRNIDDEQMPATWEYVSDLCQQAEALGYDLTLIAELNLNDIKGVEADSLDAWTTTAALAAVTKTLELMIAVRPTFHNPALLAKQAACLDRIGQVSGGGRLTLNVVSSWWRDEATKYGIPFDEHDERYARTEEWLDVLQNCWKGQHTSHSGRFYNIDDNVLSPKPLPTRGYSRAPQGAGLPTLYAGGESETAKNLIAAKCDAYLMHGDDPKTIASKIEDMKQRRAKHPHLAPLLFGVTGYCIVRDSEAEANREVERITSQPDPSQSPAGYANFQQWITGSQLEKKLSLRDYSVSNRGLHSGMIGTPEQVKQRLADFEGAGCSLVLLQSSPQHTEMARFAAQVMQRS